MSLEGIGLIAGALSHEQRKNIVHSLSQKLDSPQSIQGLLSVLPVLEADVLISLSDTVTDFIKENLLAEVDIEAFSAQIELLSKLPRSSDATLDWVFTRLISTIASRKTHVISPVAYTVFETEFATTHKDNLAEDCSIVYLLEFLEKLYSLGDLSIPLALDKLVLVLLSSTTEEATTRATKVLRWRDVSIKKLHKFTWDIIFLLSRSSETSHVTAGFILWLRFLIGTSKKSIECEQFQSSAQTEEYWSFIQNGLTSSVHEHRKYCLSILKLTIQQLQVDVDNALVTFSVKDKASQTEEWKRFATLYEIIGVDTALNQAIAAHADLVQLLSPSSFIKPSWGMALLCTGFKGNMEAVRKYSLELMFSVPRTDLSNFAHPFLTEIFLNYAIEGSHFQVKKEGDTFTCAYGERLESFVTSLIKSLKDPQVLYSTVSSIIAFLADITPLYAPSRIYLTSGVLKGLKGKQLLDSSHMPYLHRLFESESEDDVFQTSLQTMHLRMLKHIKSDVPLLLEALTRFVQYNGYEIYGDNVDMFMDYIAAYYDNTPISTERRETEFQVVVYSLLGKYGSSDGFLIELATSGLDVDAVLSSKYSELLGKLISGVSVEKYEKSRHLVELEMFKNSWRAVNLEPLYKSLLEEMDLEKLQFFTACFMKVADVTDVVFFQFGQLLSLHEKVSVALAGSNFKAKDTYSGAFLEILLSFLKMTPLTDEELTTVLEFLQSELKNGNYSAFKSTGLVIQYLLKNYENVDLIVVVEILESIWDHVTGDRLILSQRDMHMTIIETLFDERLLRDTINNEYNGRVLLKIALDVVNLSQTRRCLLPCLSSKLLQYQRAYSLEFEQTLWLIDVMIAILTLIQENSNMFKIKNVISSKYDKELGLVGGIYSKIWGPLEVSAKINIIVILCRCSQSFCDEYFNTVLSDKYTFVVPKKKANGTEELQRVYAFSSLLLISKRISQGLLSSVSITFMSNLEKEPSPWIRSYLEWIIAIDLVNSPQNRQALFQLFQDQGKPVLVTSVETVAFLVSQKLNGDESKTYFDAFSKYLIPNCASNKPLVRHFSNSLMLSLYPEIQRQKVDLPVDGILKMLYEEAQKSAVTGKYRTGDALLWDIEEDFNLVAIFGGVLSRTSPREVECITEKDFRTYIAEELFVETGSTKLPSWVGVEDSAISENNAQAQAETSPLQTKSGAWESVLDIDENVRNVKRSELIVVSSLVDKPPNLGGICRLCDVLGAGLMTVDDLRVKRHPQFKSVAVTADYWMPMEEVNISNIAEFMRAKKSEGYTLIGLEQTDKSIVLSKDTKFPPKSLFLLGKEAEGIPGELLSELDYCVEIRQLGVIRSMNIQTATAVLVHAYSTSVIPH